MKIKSLLVFLAFLGITLFSHPQTIYAGGFCECVGTPPIVYVDRCSGFAIATCEDDGARCRCVSTRPTPTIIKFSDIAPTIHPNIAPNVPLNTTIAGLFTLSSLNLINLVFFFIGLIFFANMLIAAYEFISSTGDPKRVQAATIRLQNGFLGIGITLASFIIVKLVTALIGLPPNII